VSLVVFVGDDSPNGIPGETPLFVFRRITDRIDGIKEAYAGPLESLVPLANILIPLPASFVHWLSLKVYWFVVRQLSAWEILTKIMGPLVFPTGFISATGAALRRVRVLNDSYLIGGNLHGFIIPDDEYVLLAVLNDWNRIGHGNITGFTEDPVTIPAGFVAEGLAVVLGIALDRLSYDAHFSSLRFRTIQ
jgi:hypothetical protein